MNATKKLSFTTLRLLFENSFEHKGICLKVLSTKDSIQNYINDLQHDALSLDAFNERHPNGKKFDTSKEHKSIKELTNLIQ